MYYTQIKPARLDTNRPRTEAMMIQFIMSGGQQLEPYGTHESIKFMTHIDNREDYTPSLEMTQQVETQVSILTSFFQSTNFLENKQNFYRQFRIPKRKGGHRTITAPNDHLKMIQTMQKMLLEDVLHILPHNSCHSYTKQRGIKTNAQVHQQSRYFLNIDMQDFFPSHSPEFVEKQLLNIRPLIYFPEYVKLLVQLAEYEGGLPQGTPLSPLLTNLCCVELDYQLTSALYRYYNERTDTKALIHYTRYADDCTFSSVHHFDQHEVMNVIRQTLEAFGYPYTIHPEKTRFTTHKGKNRVTGLKVNANNEVTVGYQEKRQLKNDIHNAIRDINDNNYPQIDILTRLVGWLAFLHDIEPGYYQFLCNKYTDSNSLIDYFNQVISRKY